MASAVTCGDGQSDIQVRQLPGAARFPAAALTQVERHEGPLHLLLTDVVMPEMNGRELLEKGAGGAVPGVKP